MTHPVDAMFAATREAWEAYWVVSTPWPRSPKDRVPLILRRMEIDRTRIAMLRQVASPDRRTQVMIRTLEAHARTDADLVKDFSVTSE